MRLNVQPTWPWTVRAVLASAGLVVATVCAGAIVVPRVPVPRQAYEHTLHSFQQYKAGNAVGALQGLTEVKRLMVNNPDLFALPERQNLGALIPTNLSDISLANRAAKLTKSYERLLKSLDPLSKHQTDPPLSKSPTVAVLENALRAVPKLIWVGPAVRKFSIEFRAGMNDPESTFNLKLSAPKQEASLFATWASDYNSFLINEWRATPREKRVFLTGARRDAPYVQKLKSRYASEGFMLFFYQDCTPLCDESTVGAFFGTSGAVVHIDSPGAAQSLFVPVETALISEHSGYGRKVIVIDNSELNSIAINESSIAIATLFTTCGLDALVNEDSLLCGQLVP